MSDTWEIPTLDKDPGETLKYKFDWSKELTNTGFDISSFTVTASTGITAGTAVQDGDNIIVPISGGTALATYTILCEMTDSNGQIYNRSFYLYIRAEK